MTHLYFTLLDQPPFSQAWNTSLGLFALWFNYWLPVIGPVVWKTNGYSIYTSTFNMTSFYQLVGQPTGNDAGFPLWTTPYQISVWTNINWYFYDFFTNIIRPSNIQALQAIQVPYPPNVTAVLKTEPPYTITTTTTTTSTSVSTSTVTNVLTSTTTSITTVTVSTGLSVGVVAAIAVIVAIVVGVGVYFITRRRQ